MDGPHPGQMAHQLLLLTFTRVLPTTHGPSDGEQDPRAEKRGKGRVGEGRGARIGRRESHAPLPWLEKLCAFWFGLGLPRSLQEGAAACEATQDGGRKESEE